MITEVWHAKKNLYHKTKLESPHRINTDITDQHHIPA